MSAAACLHFPSVLLLLPRRSNTPCKPSHKTHHVTLALSCVDERGNVIPAKLPILARWSDAPECTIANILKAPTHLNAFFCGCSLMPLQALRAEMSGASAKLPQPPEESRY